MPPNLNTDEMRCVYMATKARDIMDLIQKEDIKMVDFKIVDINGQFRHVTIPACHFNEDTMVNIGDKVSPGTELGIPLANMETGKSVVYFCVWKDGNPVDERKAPRT